MSLIAGIAAHKFILAIVLSSLAATGGAVVYASNSAGTLGQVSFSVSSPAQVLSMASLNLGALTPGQTVTMSTTAKVNLTATGNYTVFLMNRGILHEVFSSFNVTVGSPISASLNLTNQRDTVKVTTGVYTVSVSVSATVKSTFEHSITVTNLSFLGITFGNFVHPQPQPDQAKDNDNDN